MNANIRVTSGPAIEKQGDLAALLTTGRALPFCDGENEPMNVIYQTTEDDTEDTVVPRFIKAGGDVKRLHFINEKEKVLAFDDKRIVEAIKEACL